MQMRSFFRTAPELTGDFDPAAIAIRLVVTLLCGGVLLLGWRMLAQERPRARIPFGRRVLLNVEDAVRWRPEF